MDYEKQGLQELVDNQKKQIHELHLTLEEVSAESVALKHALEVAQGQIRLMCQDRDYIVEDAA